MQISQTHASRQSLTTYQELSLDNNSEEMNAEREASSQLEESQIQKMINFSQQDIEQPIKDGSGTEESIRDELSNLSELEFTQSSESSVTNWDSIKKRQKEYVKIWERRATDKEYRETFPVYVPK